MWSWSVVVLTQTQLCFWFGNQSYRIQCHLSLSPKWTGLPKSWPGLRGSFAEQAWVVCRCRVTWHLLYETCQSVYQCFDMFVSCWQVISWSHICQLFTSVCHCVYWNWSMDDTRNQNMISLSLETPGTSISFHIIHSALCRVRGLSCKWSQCSHWVGP